MESADTLPSCTSSTSAGRSEKDGTHPLGQRETRTTVRRFRDGRDQTLHQERGDEQFTLQSVMDTVDWFSTRAMLNQQLQLDDFVVAQFTLQPATDTVDRFSAGVVPTESAQFDEFVVPQSLQNNGGWNAWRMTSQSEYGMPVGI